MDVDVVVVTELGGVVDDLRRVEAVGRRRDLAADRLADASVVGHLEGTAPSPRGTMML